MNRDFIPKIVVTVMRAAALASAALALAQCSPLGAKYAESPGARYADDDEQVSEVTASTGRYTLGKPYTVRGQTYVPSEDPAYRAEGIASWYGPDFHGRLTANGEIFDMHAISAAHPTLPIPSYARVTNLDNGRSMIVRVNDRGPYARERLIDLSIGAAKALGFYGDGLAHVRVEYVGRAPLEGSDDRALLATLREGRPAQASPQLMLASTAPFMPGPDKSAARDKPFPAERPSAFGTVSNSVAAKPVGVPASTALARASIGSPAPRSASAGSAAPVASFAPAQDDRALGLMSGRGLY